MEDHLLPSDDNNDVVSYASSSEASSSDASCSSSSYEDDDNGEPETDDLRGLLIGQDDLFPSLWSPRSTPPVVSKLRLSRSFVHKIEENVLFKAAVQRIQQDDDVASSRPSGTTTLSNWGWTLLAPLDLEASTASDNNANNTSRSFVSFVDDDMPLKQYPKHRSLFGSGSVTLPSSDNESHFSTESFPVEIEWEDVQECPRILSQAQMQYLHDEGLPDSLQVNKWERCFAIGRDGDSFLSFLDKCAFFRHSFLVVQTTDGQILGGFVNQAWEAQEGFGKSRSYYGTGLSFLFASHPEGFEPSSPDELHIFRWTGSNDYCQICNVDECSLAMGGGDGNFGLIVEENFQRGQTGFCGTFGNPPLVTTGNGMFEVAALEVYGLVPLFQSLRPQDRPRPPQLMTLIRTQSSNTNLRSSWAGGQG